MHIISLLATSGIHFLAAAPTGHPPIIIEGVIQTIKAILGL
jgi:hypothetical protein